MIAGVSLAVLAGLIAAAVSLSLTGGSARVNPALLRVGPGAPTTATASLAYSSSEGTSGSASIALDGSTDAISATIDASDGLVTGSISARAVDGTLYVDVAGFGSGLRRPWASVAAPKERGGIGDVLSELRRPDLARLRRLGARTTATRTGAVTVLREERIRLPSLGSLPLGLPSRADATFTLTTGSSGQVLSAACVLVSLNHDVRVTATLQLTGYDQPVHVTAPAAREVAPLGRASARRLFGTDAAALLGVLGDLGSTLGGSSG